MGSECKNLGILAVFEKYAKKFFYLRMVGRNHMIFWRVVMTPLKLKSMRKRANPIGVICTIQGPWAWLYAIRSIRAGNRLLSDLASH